MDQQTPAPTPEPTRQTEPAPRNSLGIPIAIVLAAALIAGAIIFSGMQKAGNGTQVANGTQNAQVTGDVVIAPVTDKDHIRGNPNAPIVIVEYSDFDCPFCKNFHETMKQVMNDYGADGKVAWVYRNFPLESLHPNAPKLALAAECVASLGGNDAFWKFGDQIFEGRAVNEPTNPANLPTYAANAGVDKTKFNDCVNAGTFTKKVADDVQAALKTGARGTPYSILIAGGQQGVINGAQPYATVKQMIDTVLAQLGNTPK
jgi:protein-disulfide isomerase